MSQKRNDKKYEWDLNSKKFPTIDPHSKIKHTIIRDYIFEYIKTVMQLPTIPALKLSIVDGFCGGGHYNDDNKIYLGSPLVSLKAVSEAEAFLNIARKNHRSVLTQNFFIDIEKNNLEFLRSVLQEQNYHKRIGDDIHLICSDFNKILKEIIIKIKKFGGGERAIFLLDQYAYGDVPFSSIKSIFKNVKQAEVLLTFNVDSLITYLSNKRESNIKAVSNIGLKDYIPWEKIQDIKLDNKKSWKYLIQEYLSEGILKESGAKYMTIFFITPKGSNPLTYWFIHLANEYRANEVMKSIHWKHGNSFSHMLSPTFFLGYNTNYDIEVTNQKSITFSEEYNFDSVASSKIESELLDIIPKIAYDCSKPQTFTHLMSNIANHTMANEEIVRASLDYLLSIGEISISDKNGTQKRKKGKSIKQSDIIAAPAQSFFLFKD